MTESGNTAVNESLLTRCRITSNFEITPGVNLISFKRWFHFLPGQVIKISIDEVSPPRIYSICSGDYETQASVLFNIKEDGFLTPKLAAKKPGEEMWVSKPYGSFIGDSHPAWWIATGTGIAPFYSMFRSGLFENKVLIHGAGYLSQFYFGDDLEWALGDNYIRCCSRETSAGIFHGRVTDFIRETENIPPGNKFFICGKALMVVEVRDLLIERGVPFENILSEIYF